MKRLILFPVLFTSFILYGRCTFITKVYKSHFQTCDAAGSAIIEVNYDTTIKVAIYISNCKAFYDQFSRSIFIGKGNIFNDTLKITYFSSVYQSVGNKQIIINNLPFFPNANFASYPSTVFVIKGCNLVAVNSLFPTLEKCTFEE